MIGWSVWNRSSFELLEGIEPIRLGHAGQLLCQASSDQLGKGYTFALGDSKQRVNLIGAAGFQSEQQESFGVGHQIAFKLGELRLSVSKSPRNLLNDSFV